MGYKKTKLKIKDITDIQDDWILDKEDSYYLITLFLGVDPILRFKVVYDSRRKQRPWCSVLQEGGSGNIPENIITVLNATKVIPEELWKN